jgi:hypothetical protein
VLGVGCDRQKVEAVKICPGERYLRSAVYSQSLVYTYLMQYNMLKNINNL